MATHEHETLRDRVRAHAFGRLSHDQRKTTNLHLGDHVYKPEERIGPAFQNVIATKPTLLVFADDEPLANFGHPCRYLLYDADSGDFQREVAARFPPVSDARHPIKLEAFHQPVDFTVNPIIFHWPFPIWRCPIIIPDGTRYAILYSGMSNRRHLNDLEFLYRTLIDIYAFDPANIYVLNYDGTLNTQDGVQTIWPGDNTAYRIQVTGQGDQSAFEAAVDDLKSKIGELDTLLIHCNNHGDYDGAPGTSFLCTYPSWGKYYNADFSNKLAELPNFRQLIVMLEQCNSGGFNASILAKSPAAATSVASAAIESQSSYASPDGNWDSFARDWVAAQAGHDPYGATLAFNPDTDGDGRIEAEEAFAYANAVKNPSDTPNFSESSEAGGDIALGQEYVVWWWWCFILRDTLAHYQATLSAHAFRDRLNRLRPELARLTRELDVTSDRLREETTAALRTLAAATFRD